MDFFQAAMEKMEANRKASEEAFFQAAMEKMELSRKASEETFHSIIQMFHQDTDAKIADLRATMEEDLKTAEVRIDDKIQVNAEKLPRFANPHIQLLADIHEELQLTSSCTPTDEVMLQEIEDDKESLQALYLRVKQEFKEFLKTEHQNQPLRLIFLPTGYTVNTSKQVKLENLFSKFLGTGTQSLKKFTVLPKLSILEYILPKKRVPPDKIFLFDAILYFILYFCNYLY